MKANYQLMADPPGSGGSDKDMIQEKSGLLEKDKQKLAQDEVEKRAHAPEQQAQAQSEQHAAFSINNPPNSDPRKK